MWEAIEKNKRKSMMLIAIMGLILVGLGMIIGLSLDPQNGWWIGAGAAVILWAILMIAALTQGDQIILASAGARRIKKQDCPRLFNVVEEMTIASGMGVPPAIYILEDDSPNAFAVGRNPKKAAVAITTGLLSRLNRDELQGVMAHEVAHIKNEDVRFLTIAAVMVGSVAILSDFFLRAMFYGAGRRRSSKGGGHPAIMIAGILAAILAPIAARMLYFACSRSREYLADASAARFTRYPPRLASALEKIAGHARSSQDKKVNQALAPLYIVNPLQAHSMQAASLFSTHPPTARRIKILRTMAGGAGYADYETAFRKVEGRSARCIGDTTLTSKEGKSVAAREASEEAVAEKSAQKKDAIERTREVTDMLDRMAEMIFISCACGVRIKTPPEYKKETINCTSCGRTHTIPHAEVQEIMAVGEAIKASGALGDSKGSETGSPLDLANTGQAEQPPQTQLPPLRYQRTGAGWESFKCSCDKTIQLSPGFRGSAMLCTKCKRQIEIVAAEEQPA